MGSVMTTIGIALISGIIGALLAFFITTLSQRKMFTDIVNAALKTHIRINHKHSIEDIIDKHEKECTAPEKLDRIEKALCFLVGQLGGDAKTMGLI